MATARASHVPLGGSLSYLSCFADDNERLTTSGKEKRQGKWGEGGDSGYTRGEIKEIVLVLLLRIRSSLNQPLSYPRASETICSSKVCQRQQ